MSSPSLPSRGLPMAKKLGIVLLLVGVVTVASLFVVILVEHVDTSRIQLFSSSSRKDATEHHDKRHDSHHDSDKHDRSQYDHYVGQSHPSQEKNTEIWQDHHKGRHDHAVTINSDSEMNLGYSNAKSQLYEAPVPQDGQDPGIHLQPDATYAGKVAFGQYTYYWFKLASDTTILSIQVWGIEDDGMVNLYVKCGEVASMHNYDYSVESTNYNQSLQLPVPDAESGVYSVAVYGYQQTPSFNIELLTVNSPFLLVNDVPEYGVLLGFSPMYYAFEVEDIANFELTTNFDETVDDLNITMYVGLDYVPTPKNFTATGRDFVEYGDNQTTCLYITQPVSGTYFVLIQQNPQENSPLVQFPYTLTVDMNTVNSGCGSSVKRKLSVAAKKWWARFL
eukprot:TRINITY_DN8935_c0_g1_i1.p1 TRINITY_DN8935_c0_g1~~TRINITY_DN8935_c0_g1_i1.p1  ORF type:complete len:399 (-),score=67.65 TRINITY_DN8935_c0_g1_i1:151-1323(-)